MCAVGPSEFGADPDRVCSYVRCLAFYAMLDIRDAGTCRRYLMTEQLAFFSPAAQIDIHAATMPPIFVMRAGRNQVAGLNTSMQTFLEIAIKENAPITLMIHPMAVHGFETTTDDDRSREILRAAIEFMRRHVGLSTGP